MKLDKNHSLINEDSKQQYLIYIDSLDDLSATRIQRYSIPVNKKVFVFKLVIHSNLIFKQSVK